MAITFNHESGIFTLQTAHSTYQMQVSEYGALYHLYYGRNLHGAETGYLVQLADHGFSVNPPDAEGRQISLDYLPQEYPTFGVGDFRPACLAVVNHDGSNAVNLRYVSHEISSGKPAIAGLPSVIYDGAQTLAMELKDRESDMSVTLVYSVIEEYDVICRSCVIRNQGQHPVVLDRALSCCLELPTDQYELMTFYGRHSLERMVQRVPLSHGELSVGSLRGTSSHQFNPFAILCEPDATEETGECFGMSLVYSGNFIISASVDQYHTTRLMTGIHPENFRFKLESGESFAVPEVVLCHSGNGLSGLSGKLHQLTRRHICRGRWKEERRPILINNWEATYFQFDEEKLYEIAKQAKELGVEMLVMDDGWFGKRDSDTSGLGDWVVNEKKLKGGLSTLVERINALGMKFGIWFEPEMISEDSDLFRAHPDWRIAVAGREPARGREQFVLDLSRQDVRQYLYHAVSSILKSTNISYVKWDMNRHITDLWSAQLPAERMGELSHRYVLGVYELMDRITGEFPDVLFEGCSGGGGRFDLGMLYYTPQIWCSDNTDAINRLQIQYGTSFGYPISSVGAHVSASPNHQTGRITPLNTRGIVAMAGTFGYELDVSKMTAEEKESVKQQLAVYKRNYETINFGQYYRLTDVNKNRSFAAWEFVSEDGLRVLFNLVRLFVEANSPFFRVKLRGLEEEASYRDENTGAVYQGSALMYAGLAVPYGMKEYEALQIELVRI